MTYLCRLSTLVLKVHPYLIILILPGPHLGYFLPFLDLSGLFLTWDGVKKFGPAHLCESCAKYIHNMSIIFFLDFWPWRLTSISLTINIVNPMLKMIKIMSQKCNTKFWFGVTCIQCPINSYNLRLNLNYVLERFRVRPTESSAEADVRLTEAKLSNLKFGKREPKLFCRTKGLARAEHFLKITELFGLNQIFLTQRVAWLS